jgi:hypothetical protein
MEDAALVAMAGSRSNAREQTRRDPSARASLRDAETVIRISVRVMLSSLLARRS